MTVRILIVGLADGRPTNIDGAWLRRSDVDDVEGRGRVYGTADPRLAMTFPGYVEAFAYYTRVSTVSPVRPDGKPNKPLTAYTIQVQKVPENEPLPDLPPGTPEEVADELE